MLELFQEVNGTGIDKWTVTYNSEKQQIYLYMEQYGWISKALWWEKLDPKAYILYYSLYMSL